MVSAQVLQERMGLADTSLLKETLPGSSAHGILQARILEWLAMLSSR